MKNSHNVRMVTRLGLVTVAAIMLAGCETMGGFGSRTQAPVEPPPPPDIPASIRAEEVVGNWGFTSYHKESDRARTERAAQTQCRQPYVIRPGANGGVIMHLADEAVPVELRLKGSVSGKNYIGLEGPAGSEKDREIVSFDGRVMVTRFVDKDAGVRYGNMIYVRCGPRA